MCSVIRVGQFLKLPVMCLSSWDSKSLILSCVCIVSLLRIRS